MAWEKRRRRRYYYEKRRSAGRVESDYVGAVEAAEVIATLGALYREEQSSERQQWQHERESHRAADAEIDRLEADIRLLVAAALLASPSSRWTPGVLERAPAARIGQQAITCASDRPPPGRRR
jgi:hypothetical protein